MRTFNGVDEALGADLVDKDVIKIYFGEEVEFYVYRDDIGELTQFQIDAGSDGLPDPKHMPDNYLLACGEDVWATHDGYWICFRGGSVDDWKPTLNIQQVFEALTYHFVPPDGCSHSITFDVNTDKLWLGVWLNSKIVNFAINQDEIRDSSKLIKEIEGLTNATN